MYSRLSMKLGPSSGNWNQYADFNPDGFSHCSILPAKSFLLSDPRWEKKTLPADRFSSCTQPVWKGRKGEKTEMVPDFALKNYTVFY